MFLKTLTPGTLETLGNCENSLFSACSVSDLPEDNTADSLGACQDSAVQFRGDYEACTRILNYTTRCGCITKDIRLLNFTTCNISVLNNVYDTIQNARNECITGYILI